jgi:hypothetical protein
MIRHYWYDQQIKKYIIGFANIFTGLQVTTGKDASGNIITLDVPIRYGSTDRVVAALASSNTQNKLHTVPMMSCYMTALELAPERMHGVNQTDRRTYLEQGGVFPDDVKMIRRVMPIPYNMIMDLAIIASNTDQLYQILEQILILFDYDLQLQFNDSAFDWTKISKLTLTSLNNEENYPLSGDRREIMWTLSFDLPVWLSPPAEIRTDLIKMISIRIGDIDGLSLDEIDQNGDLVPFMNPYSEMIITSDVAVTPVDPNLVSSRVTAVGIEITPGDPVSPTPSGTPTNLTQLP